MRRGEEVALISEIIDLISVGLGDPSERDAEEYFAVAEHLSLMLDPLTRNQHRLTTRIGQAREVRERARIARLVAWRDLPNDGQHGGWFAT